MHIISKNIYLITLYKLGDNLLCVVIDGQKFQEYSTYNDVSLDQQFMVEMLSYVANHYFYPVIDCLNIKCRTLIVLCMTLVGCYLCMARLY